MNQESQPQGVPVVLDELIERLNELSRNLDIKYELQDSGKITCKYSEGDWKGEFTPPELLNALEDIYSEEQMKLIALGGEEGVAR